MLCRTLCVATILAVCGVHAAAQHLVPTVGVQHCYRVVYPDSVDQVTHLRLPEFLLFEPAPDSGVVRGGISSEEPNNFWLSFLTHGEWRHDGARTTARFGAAGQSVIYRFQVARGDSIVGQMMVEDAVKPPTSVPVRLTTVLCREGHFQGEAGER